MKDTRMIRGFVLCALVALFSFGCSNPCDDVKEQCDACGDEFTKELCNAVVAADDGDTCDAALDSKTFESCQ
jgi:hypothetical protein